MQGHFFNAKHQLNYIYTDIAPAFLRTHECIHSEHTFQVLHNLCWLDHPTIEGSVCVALEFTQRAEAHLLAWRGREQRERGEGGRSKNTNEDGKQRGGRQEERIRMIKLSYQHCWRGPILCSTVHVDWVLCALSINHSSRASATCGFIPTMYLLSHSQHMSHKLFNFAK